MLGCHVASNGEKNYGPGVMRCASAPRMLALTPANWTGFWAGSATSISLTLKLGILRQLQEVSLKLSLQELAHLWRQRLCDRVPVQYLTGQTTWRNFTLRVTTVGANSSSRNGNSSSTGWWKPWRVVPIGTRCQQGTWVEYGNRQWCHCPGVGRGFLQQQILLPSIKVLTPWPWPGKMARAYDMENRITFYQGSWFEPLAADCSLTAMVSNPPYIPTDILKQPTARSVVPRTRRCPRRWKRRSGVHSHPGRSGPTLPHSGWPVDRRNHGGAGESCAEPVGSDRTLSRYSNSSRSGGVGSLCHGVQTLVARLPGRQLGVR